MDTQDTLPRARPSCSIAPWGTKTSACPFPSEIAYNRYRDDFGSDEISYIVYEAPGRAEGPFDLEVMRRVAQLTEAIEDEVPFVKEVTSLANVEYLEGVADGIEIYDLLEEFPESAAAMRDVRAKVLAEPLYVNGLITPDGGYGAIGISVDDTIHHMTRFRVEFQRSGSYEVALRNSLLDVGRALFITSTLLVLGFLVFRFSTLDTLVIFGTLLATTVGVALLADFPLMPALVLTFRPFGPEGGRRTGADSPSA